MYLIVECLQPLTEDMSESTLRPDRTAMERGNGPQTHHARTPPRCHTGLGLPLTRTAHSVSIDHGIPMPGLKRSR